MGHEKNTKVLHHGSGYGNVIPDYNYKKYDNDFGPGFYLSEDEHITHVWAVAYSTTDEAYDNTYALNTTDLKILDLTKLGPLAAIAEVAANRGPHSDDIVTPEAKNALKEFVERYRNPDLAEEKYDVIIGPRFGGSYMRAIGAFLEGKITIEETYEHVMKGDLGRQICLKSEKAHKQCVLESCKKLEWVEEYRHYADKDKAETKGFLRDREKQIKRGIPLPKGLTIDDFTNEHMCECHQNGDGTWTFEKTSKTWEEEQWERMSRENQEKSSMFENSGEDFSGMKQSYSGRALTLNGYNQLDGTRTQNASNSQDMEQTKTKHVSADEAGGDVGGH